MWLPKELQTIILKYPDAKAKIIQLYHNDSNFKSLCEDYWLSRTLHTKYKESVYADIVLENEYESICLLLEKEVTKYLTKN
jgi:hypothetical protein